MSHKLWLHEMTWPEIDEVLNRTSTVLVPMGSTEQHGPHLPEGTDTYVPSHLAELVALETGVPIAPPVWLTTCESQSPSARYITLLSCSGSASGATSTTLWR